MVEVTIKPILIFDFDGVIVDGLLEYWSSSRQACLDILPKDISSLIRLPKQVPDSFRKLRPWVKNGWEMVLLAAEHTRPTSQLVIEGAEAFSTAYQKNCFEALKAWQWTPEFLQNALNNSRKRAIKKDFQHWIASHQTFPGVIERIHLLDREGVEFGVLTTKSAEFTSHLLEHLSLQPNLLYGYESGSKPELLLQISKTHSIKGFIEDRRSTLETVLQTPELNFIPCYLASWGYLKPDDYKDLPANINLLEPKVLMSPLANWS